MGPTDALPPEGYQALHPGAWRLESSDLGPASRWDGHGKAPLEPLAPGLFRYRPVSPTWAKNLAKEGRHLRRWLLAQGELPAPANSLSDYGFDLAPLGFAPLLKALLEHCIEPWRERLFPELKLPPLDRVHGFLVEYGTGRDQDLAYHVDDSELTLNLCLDGDFVGSEVVFAGLRCLEHRQRPIDAAERIAVEHEPGVALLHAGALRHWVEPIQAGTRSNLILWASKADQETHSGLTRSAACPACMAPD